MRRKRETERERLYLTHSLPHSLSLLCIYIVYMYREIDVLGEGRIMCTHIYILFDMGGRETVYTHVYREGDIIYTHYNTHCMHMYDWGKRHYIDTYIYIEIECISFSYSLWEGGRQYIHTYVGRETLYIHITTHSICTCIYKRLYVSRDRRYRCLS